MTFRSDAPQPGFGGHWPRLLLISALLLTAGAVAYHNSLTGPFIFDDNLSIVKNPHIRRLWPLWEAMRWDPGSTVAARPLISLSLAVNYALGGLDVRGYHLFNLAVHLGAGLLLLGILRRTLSLPQLRVRYGSSGDWVALAAALWWLVHPLQTESVTYIVQRAESLMGFFFLAALYCAIRGALSLDSRAWLGASVLSSALGMASKEVMVVAPLLVFAYDALFISGSPQKALRARPVFYSLLGATWIILVAALLSGPRLRFAGFGLEDITAWEYGLTQLEVISHYLRLAFWPEPLILDYAWPVVTNARQVLLPALLIGGLMLATLEALRRRAGIGYLGLWFFMILAPTSSIMPIWDIAFEHRMYLSLAAVTVCAALAGELLLRRCVSHPPMRGFVAVAGIAAISIPLMLATVSRNAAYASSLTIWQTVVNHRPDNPRGHSNIGTALQIAGRLDESIAAYHRALELDPEWAELHNNLALAYSRKGELEQALPHYLEAIRLDPDFASAHASLGQAMALLGRWEESRRAYERALVIEPGMERALRGLEALRLQAASRTGKRQGP